VKKEPICAGDIDCCPYLALRYPWLPDLPSPPYRPKARRAKERCLNHRVGRLAVPRPQPWRAPHEATGASNPRPRRCSSMPKQPNGTFSKKLLASWVKDPTAPENAMTGRRTRL